MTNFDWRKSCFQRLKVFGALERPERKQAPLGGSRNTKLHQAELWKKCSLCNNSLSRFVFENVIFFTLFQWCLHVGIWPKTNNFQYNCHKRKIKQAKTNKQWTGTEDWLSNIHYLTDEHVAPISVIAVFWFSSHHGSLFGCFPDSL